MKYLQNIALALAIALCFTTPMFAQHGHPGGTGGSMGSDMGHGASAHNMGANIGSGSASPHRMTVDQQLSKNTKLAGKIQGLTGMSAEQACDGFKNLGQCVAAAHVSKNLDISFACLKADMTKTTAPSGSSCPAGTGTKSMSLGKAIQTLSPSADSKAESKKAGKQADDDLKETHAS
jgi:hypothetical protein